jgi:hypothetical protein
MLMSAFKLQESNARSLTRKPQAGEMMAKWHMLSLERGLLLRQSMQTSFILNWLTFSLAPSLWARVSLEGGVALLRTLFIVIARMESKLMMRNKTLNRRLRKFVPKNKRTKPHLLYVHHSLRLGNLFRGLRLVGYMTVLSKKPRDVVMGSRFRASLLFNLFFNKNLGLVRALQLTQLMIYIRSRSIRSLLSKK